MWRTLKLIGLVAAASFATGCASMQQEALGDAMLQIEKETGLAEINIPDTEKLYLGKTHRGYDILFHGEAGNVWGRYAARLAMFEVGREVGGVMAFLTGSQEWDSGPAGSVLDRLLARVIGQPLSITMILKHNRSDMPRLDIYSISTPVKPDDRQPKAFGIGLGPGSVYTSNAAFAHAIEDNTGLTARLKKMRNPYIRVDEIAVTLLWTGQEKDFSYMINDHDGYMNMLNAFMDSLADIADAAVNGS